MHDGGQFAVLHLVDQRLGQVVGVQGPGQRHSAEHLGRAAAVPRRRSPGQGHRSQCAQARVQFPGVVGVPGPQQPHRARGRGPPEPQFVLRQPVRPFRGRHHDLVDVVEQERRPRSGRRTPQRPPARALGTQRRRVRQADAQARPGFEDTARAVAAQQQDGPGGGVREPDRPQPGQDDSRRGGGETDRDVQAGGGGGRGRHRGQGQGAGRAGRAVVQCPPGRHQPRPHRGMADDAPGHVGRRAPGVGEHAEQPVHTARRVPAVFPGPVQRGPEQQQPAAVLALPEQPHGRGAPAAPGEGGEQPAVQAVPGRGRRRVFRAQVRSRRRAGAFAKPGSRVIPPFAGASRAPSGSPVSVSMELPCANEFAPRTKKDSCGVRDDPRTAPSAALVGRLIRV